MKVWAAKDPDEVVRASYDWGPDLSEGEVIDGIVTVDTITAAGTTLAGQVFDDQFTTLIISGGTDGQEAQYLIRVHTSLGETLEDVVALPIAAKVVSVPYAGGFVAPTPANLIDVFPEFAGVSSGNLSFYLGRAAARVDESWSAEDFGYARMLLAAHLLTTAGLGSSAEAAAISNGSGEFRSMGVGPLRLERFDRGAAGGWSSTRYGREFLQLLRVNRGGPRVTGGLILGPAAVPVVAVPQAIIYSDFQNSDYRINGAPVTFADLWRDGIDVNWYNHDPATIVPGVGYRAADVYDEGLVLTDAAFATLNARAGFSYIMDLTQAGPYGANVGASAGLDIVELPSYDSGCGMNSGSSYNAYAGYQIYDYANFTHREMVSTIGAHKLAVTMSESLVALAVDGTLRLQEDTTIQSFAACTHVGIEMPCNPGASSYIRKVEFWRTVSLAALPALSA